MNINKPTGFPDKNVLYHMPKCINIKLLMIKQIIKLTLFCLDIL